MAFRTKLLKAETQITATLCSVPGRIYARAELAKHFYKVRAQGLLAKHTKLEEFIEFLVQRRRLLSITLKSEEYGKAFTRYCVGSPSPFVLAASLHKSGYLSHGTAAYLHQLTEAPPEQIYLNVEQSVKPTPEASLSQPAIDRAFAGRQRQSNLTYRNKGLQVTILAGKNTRQAGVNSLAHPEAQGVRATNLERTLIDIAVRPAYAGGIAQVLKAYQVARDRVSMPMLLSILDILNHVYPYPQAIGFLMQRAYYGEDSLALLRSRISEFKFYLTHGLKDPAYDKGWRLFHPPGF
jgi:hypothetical protein